MLLSLGIARLPLTLQGILHELWDGLLWAAPKKRTTHSKKRKRMAGKWPKPLLNLRPCPFCGSTQLMGHACRECLKKLTS
ncbi:MAG: hypothetical protein SGCHY_005530 [Lobulomycetales sp.]